MFFKTINSTYYRLFLNRINSNFISNFRLTNSVQCLNKASLSTQSEDISIVSSVKVDSGALLSQSDILEPQNFYVEPLDLSRTNPSLTPIREVWVENMSTPNSIKLGILSLHPDIFAAFPRPDLIQENHKWQVLYKHVDWRCMQTRAEMRGTKSKPWPQKGLGKARHGSRRSPQWINGGWATGPRGPRTYFYMLPHHKRVAGLVAMLSSKLAQNDLHVVDTFQTFPTDASLDHLEELCETRGWGPSVLFVDKVELDLAPQCTQATHFHEISEQINHINVIPMYSLNVFSMLKHETLVFTEDAIRDIQQKLLFQLKRIDLKTVIYKYKPEGVYRL